MIFYYNYTEMFYYRKTDPALNELVFAKILLIDNLGVKIKLIEYDDKEGYILYSNLSKRKEKQIKQLYKPSKDIIVEFVEVFEGVMSFTDKNIDEDSITEFENNFKKYQKIVNMILNFLKMNKDIESKSFIDSVLYNFSSEEDYNPFDIISVFNRIIKEEVIDFELEPDIKNRFFEFLKKVMTDTKFKGMLKYESFSPNSSGLFEIKNFYLDVVKFSKENDINITVKLDSSPTFIISFDDEKYHEKMKEKVDKIVDYISSQKIKFSNKLVSNTITEH